MSADEQAIRKLIDDWMLASARGDLAKVLSMMSDDVVFMTVGRKPDGAWVITRDANLMPG